MIQSPLPFSPLRGFLFGALALALGAVVGCADAPPKTVPATFAAPNLLGGKSVATSSAAGAARLVDGSPAAFTFADGKEETERVSISGFQIPVKQGLRTLRFYDDGSGFTSGRTPNHVTLYFSPKNQSDLSPSSYTRLGGFALTFKNTDETDAAMAKFHVATLSGLAIPASARSLLLDFGLNGNGFIISEIQGFADNGPVGRDLGEIMPLGDSITQGGYRRFLLGDLNGRGTTFSFVGTQTTASDGIPNLDPPQTHHEGHGGYRIGDIESNLDGLNDQTTGYPRSTNHGGFWFPGIPDGPEKRPAVYPNIILLHAGTNDITLGATPEQARDRLRALITRIVTDRPKAQLIVASITPRTDDKEGANAAYDALIPALLKEPAFAGKNISFVDMHSKLTPKDLGDAVHPSDVGYQKMADAWLQAILALPHTTKNQNPASKSVAPNSNR